MTIAWSDELRVLWHPVSAYRDIAQRPMESSAWTLLRRPLATMSLIGAFVSFTTTGRLVLPFVLDGLLWWSFLPALQVVVLVLVVRQYARHPMPISRAVDLFFVGQAPWWLWLLGLSGLVVNLPRAAPDLLAFNGWLLPLSAVGCLAWSVSTTFGFFRGVIGASPRRSAAATLLYSFGLWGFLVCYLIAVEVVQRHRLPA